jgi:sterol 24-C-methyltransferase
MKMPIKDNTYDAIYAIEATCHAPSKEGIYGEIFRVLKPGSLFAGEFPEHRLIFSAYEWCLTDKFNASNPDHQKVFFGTKLRFED